MLSDSERNMMELNNSMVEAEERENAKAFRRKALLSVGRWFADNLVAIGALVVSVIALVRTL